MLSAPCLEPRRLPRCALCSKRRRDADRPGAHRPDADHSAVSPEMPPPGALAQRESEFIYLEELVRRLSETCELLKTCGPATSCCAHPPVRI